MAHPVERTVAAPRWCVAPGRVEESSCMRPRAFQSSEAAFTSFAAGRPAGSKRPSRSLGSQQYRDPRIRNSRRRVQPAIMGFLDGRRTASKTTTRKTMSPRLKKGHRYCLGLAPYVRRDQGGMGVRPRETSPFRRRSVESAHYGRDGHGQHDDGLESGALIAA